MFSKQLTEKWKQELQQRLDNIDQIIISQETIKDKKDKFRTEFRNQMKHTRNYINFQTIKLKEIIEKKSEELKSKLIDVEDNFLEKFDTESSLNIEKSSLKNIIEKGSDYEIRKARLNIFKTDVLILKHTKLIQIERPIFTMPLIDAESPQAKDLFGSIQIIPINGMIDILKNETLSKDYLNKYLCICAMKQDLFILDSLNIHVFDMHLNNFKSSIDMKINIAKNLTSINIIGISNVLFILFVSENIEECIIYKFDLQNYICTKWKTMMECSISSTNHATILATTGNNELIEFSLDGLQLKLIKYSVDANCTLTRCFDTSYQLVDGRYVATHQDEQLFHLYLIDSEGNVIKSNSIEQSDDTTMCTDNDKYIFVSDYNTEIIIVFSTELHKIREFHITKLNSIFYDRGNKQLLVRTEDEILFVNYNEESFKDI